jgi:hypothetical protein
MAETGLIRTPDQQVRVFVSSALQELAAERRAVRDATTDLRLVPVMFELGRQREDPGRTVRLLAAADALLQAAGTGWLLAYAATAPSEMMPCPGCAAG